MWLEVSFTKFALAVARRMEQGVGKVSAVPGPVGGPGPWSRRELMKG